VAAVLDRRTDGLDPETDGSSASVWDEALLGLAEDPDDEEEREMPGSVLPDLLDFSLQ
jgi:hypothetical protein